MATRQRNEGEGNRTADKQYVEATKKFVRAGKVDPAARKAKQSLDTPEAAELKKAEDIGRSHAHGEK